VRVVSDILESNGSSSMASVCGGTLSLMDAGVPITAPVAGISIGLVKEPDRFTLPTDIMGDEDHFGDMDFKVAGTGRGITGIQLDLKIDGIDEAIIRATLDQARDARREILRAMLTTLRQPREKISEFAPRLLTVQINPEKIGLLIGPGGKTIKGIQESTGAKIDIDDDGTIKVAAVDGDAAQAAIEWIRGIVAEPELGAIYNGKVVKTVDFGAFVNFLGSRDGLVHISELAPQRVGKVADVIKLGDAVKVKVLGFDDRGKVKLSMRQVDQQTGEDLGAARRPEPAKAAL
jgi:polyribonucleotide nucleotidyltransferase